jgi:hypothetical protein
MSKPYKIFADFNNADKKGRIRLDTNGSIADIKKLKVEMQPGMEIWLTDNDSLKAKGVIEYSAEEQIWVAVIDWNDFI